MGEISLNFDSIWSNAVDIIESMWPIFVIPLGIVFGFGILSKIIKEIRGAIGGA